MRLDQFAALVKPHKASSIIIIGLTGRASVNNNIRLDEPLKNTD